MKGSCLCDAVRIQVAGELEHDPEACHCRQCRKHFGSYAMGVNVRRSRLTVIGEEHVRWYRSSPQVERGFCGICGSTLFWRPDLDGYEWTSVAIGLFDGKIGRKLAKHTFVGEKSDCYEIADDVPQHMRF